MRALIVYASLTGNTKDGADIIKEEFENHEVETELLESAFADPIEFLEYDLVLVGTYTYGINGQLPDEIVDFYEELQEIDLTGKVYGTFGSGDTFYEEYCKSVDDFNEVFERTNAVKGGQSVKYELDPEEQDIENLVAFAKSMIETYKHL